MEDPKTMADSTTPQWEMVVETIKGQDYTQRLRVDTGYLYCRTTIAGATSKAAGQVATAMTLVPDRATP
jgi:hypothetical protein